MNLIKILFLKKRAQAGVLTYQNNLLHVFNESTIFKLIVVDEQAKIRKKFLNKIYTSIQSFRIIKVIFNYLYLSIIIRKWSKREGADYLFIPHYFKYGLLALLMYSLFKIPFIVPILGWNGEEYRLRGASKVEIFIRVKYEYWVLRRAKYILASDDLIKGYGKFIKNKNKFLSIDSPIDVNKFKPMPKYKVLKNKLKVNNKKVILTLTSLGGDKADGLKILLEAFVLVKKDFNKVVLLIAGDGPKKKEFEDTIEKMSEKDDIRLLGYCNNIVELINLSDIFVLIFLVGGGVGAATKEAMACEKPCVVVRTSGTEVLNDRKEVLLVNLNPKDIAEKIVLLLRNEKYAQSLGINGRKRIEADFSLTKAEKELVKKLNCT